MRLLSIVLLALTLGGCVSIEGPYVEVRTTSPYPPRPAVSGEIILSYAEWLNYEPLPTVHWYGYGAPRGVVCRYSKTYSINFCFDRGRSYGYPSTLRCRYERSAGWFLSRDLPLQEAYICHDAARGGYARYYRRY